MCKKESRLIIGWYCPFSYPLMMGNYSLHLHQIQWKQNSYVTENNNRKNVPIKLCKKLTTIDSLINSDICDGIVMVDCCNMSYIFYEYVSKIDSYASVHLMQIPRKESVLFSDIIKNEQHRLEDWLYRLKKKARNDGMIKSKKEDFCTQSESFYDSFFCKLPNSYVFEYKGNNEISCVRELMKIVNCPRMLKEYRVVDMDGLDNIIDEICVNQQYCVAPITTLYKEAD